MRLALYDLQKGISKFLDPKIKVDFLFIQEKHLHMIKKFQSDNIIYESLNLTYGIPRKG